VLPDAAADLIDPYLGWYFDRYPVQADALGAPGFGHRLGDFTAAAFENRDREVAGWLARFEAAPDGIDGDIDRDLVVSALRGEVLLAEWPAWRRDPSVYLTPVFAGLLLPFLHQLRPEAELVDAAVARLAELPDVLAACRENLDPALAAPLLVRRALGQAASGAAFLRDSLPAEVRDPGLRTRLVEAGALAAEAFETTTAFLTSFAERATGDWRMGEQLYSALLTQRELLGYGSAELHRRGEAAWADRKSVV